MGTLPENGLILNLNMFFSPLAYSKALYHLQIGKSNVQNQQHVVHCTIWYHLYNSKNVKNTHEGVLLLVKLQAWVFFMFFKL